MHPQKILAASAVLLATTHAHMFIISPEPIFETDSKSPLDPNGSQFPCQGKPLPATGGQRMAAGSDQKLAFDLGHGANTAVHGGGSCQLSITYETDPAKQKDPVNWKVIYSIEGGCPTDAPGNLQEGKAVDCVEGSTDTACVNEFPFTIPKGVKDGHAIMAWTWFNNVGNREMYMNCMNVNFTDGDGSEIDTFPPLFVANQKDIGECPTTEQINVQFPNPGKYVTTKTEAGTYTLAIPSGPGCNAAGATGTPPAPSAAAPTPYGPAPSPPDLPSVSAPSITTTALTSSSTTSSPPDPAPTSPDTSPSSSCPVNTLQCPTPGALICFDTDHFGLCHIDFCAQRQDVARGTQCVDGQIVHKDVERGGHVGGSSARGTWGRFRYV